MYKIKSQLIPELLAQRKNLAQKKADLIMAGSRQQILETAGKEVERLIHLQKINPNIQENEIIIARDNLKELLDHLSRSALRLYAVRLIRLIANG